MDSGLCTVPMGGLRSRSPMRIAKCFLFGLPKNFAFLARSSCFRALRRGAGHHIVSKLTTIHARIHKTCSYNREHELVQQLVLQTSLICEDFGAATYTHTQTLTHTYTHGTSYRRHNIDEADRVRRKLHCATS